jgi:coproporphyrinogen III oxidase-like Fe-S oxidoreductase
MNKDEISFFYKYFLDLPDLDMKNEALRLYLSLNSNYKIAANHMPLPVWRREGFKDQGITTWKRLRAINEKILIKKPISIYIHIPFCPSRCSFCDCLTTALTHNINSTLDDYLIALLSEIEAWKSCAGLISRPVNTIHFGGGTPIFFGKNRFSLLVESLRNSFSVNPLTEWAIETTSSSLTSDVFRFLDNLGFRRLHLGVQSMEDHVRPLLKRRENRSQILEKIMLAREMDWVTSVDLLVGLPKETLSGVLKGINDLIVAGTDGFSVYEINLSSQNRLFTSQYSLNQRDRRANYLLFLASVIQLNRAGFSKNLFNHFATERDKNVYFTFPVRFEDCLAIGAYADGVFQDYHYRHVDYQRMIRETTNRNPAFEGGIEKSHRAKLLFPIEISVLSGNFFLSELEKVLSQAAAEKIIHSWESAMLVESIDNERYTLTPNGAWFSGNMINDLSLAEINDDCDI